MVAKKKHKPVDKATAERWHFKEQIHKRWGIQINDSKYHGIIDSIQFGIDPPAGMEVIFFRKVSLMRSLYLLKANEKRLVIVYDKKRRELITALPETAWELKEANRELL